MLAGGAIDPSEQLGNILGEREERVEIGELRAVARQYRAGAMLAELGLQGSRLAIERIQSLARRFDAEQRQADRKEQQRQPDHTGPPQPDQGALHLPAGLHFCTSCHVALKAKETGWPGSLVLISWLESTTSRRYLVCSSRSMYAKTAGKLRAIPPMMTFRLRGSGCTASNATSAFSADSTAMKRSLQGTLSCCSTAFAFCT